MEELLLKKLLLSVQEDEDYITVSYDTAKFKNTLSSRFKRIFLVAIALPIISFSIVYFYYDASALPLQSFIIPAVGYLISLFFIAVLYVRIIFFEAEKKMILKKGNKKKKSKATFITGYKGKETREINITKVELTPQEIKGKVNVYLIFSGKSKHKPVTFNCLGTLITENDKNLIGPVKNLLKTNILDKVSF